MTLETCKCGHAITKHLHGWFGSDTKEYGACALCPCRLFRRDAS